MLKTYASLNPGWRNIEFRPRGEKEPIGYAILSDNHTLWNVYIDPLRRGKGLGKRMMAEIVKKFGRPLRLTVDEKNEIAIRCYQAVGFKVVKPRKSKGEPALGMGLGSGYLHMKLK